MIAKAFNAAKWIPLVRTLVARVPLIPGTYEDAVQEVLLYIHQKSQNGVWVDVRKAVHWAIADWRRGAGCDFIKVPRSLYDRGYPKKSVFMTGACSLGDDEEDLFQIQDPAPNGFRRIDDRLEIEVFLNWVTTNEAFILRNSVQTGGALSDEECAREINLCGSRVSQLRAQGLRKIRERLRELRRLPESP